MHRAASVQKRNPINTWNKNSHTGVITTTVKTKSVNTGSMMQMDASLPVKCGNMSTPGNRVEAGIGRQDNTRSERSMEETTMTTAAGRLTQASSYPQLCTIRLLHQQYQTRGGTITTGGKQVGGWSLHEVEDWTLVGWRLERMNSRQAGGAERSGACDASAEHTGRWRHSRSTHFLQLARQVAQLVLELLLTLWRLHGGRGDVIRRNDQPTTPSRR